MLYRDVQHAVDSMQRIHAPLRQAILADSTREMTERGGQAQAAADELLRQLEQALQGKTSALEARSDEGKVERFFVQAATNALQRAMADAQRILLGTDASGVRAGLLDFKTQVDFADAYLRAAIGAVET
jgi:hypothetical protein